MVQVLAGDWLPISVLMAVAITKLLLSSDFFLDDIARLTLALFAWLEAGCQAGRARDGLLHGHVCALVSGNLNVIRRPFRLIDLGSGVRRAWKVREGHR